MKKIKNLGINFFPEYLKNKLLNIKEFFGFLLIFKN